MKQGVRKGLWVVALWLCGCGGGGGGTTAVTVTISPTTATVKLRATQQFTATVTGATSTLVTWSVNGVNGGNSTVGTVSSVGLYTAPANALNPSTVNVTVTSNADATKSATATVTIDTGATVTVSPASATLAAGETLQFTAKVTNSPNIAVTWQVNMVTGGNASTGSISSAGLYTAPSNLTTSLSVAINAVLQADTSRIGTANVTVLPQGAPLLSSINPSTAAEGSFFQDVYLIGSSFLSTSIARVNGTPVPTTFVNGGVLRARVPASFFTIAGVLFLDVQQQAGGLSAVARLNVVPVRPVFTGTTPDSARQGGGSVSVNFDGGYYSPSVIAEFNGQARSATVTNSRQLNVTVTAQDLAAAGLFPVTIRNTALPGQIAGVNLAVESSLPPAVLATLNVGTLPSAVAVNTATGIAVVCNQGSNSVSLIDLGTNSVVGSPIPVGTGPTGVAVDNLRNLAVVVNNGSNSVSIIDLSSTPPVVTATVPTDVQAAPFSAGVDPLTGLALIVYQNSGTASLLDLSTSRIKSDTQIGPTGTTPQVSVDSRLGWAIVSPGGVGTLSIVSLAGSGTTVVAQIAAPSANGAVRKSNVVTITTTGPHSLTVGETVTISGVADSSFNGTFSVTAVPSVTTFSYSQNGSDATSGNGMVSAPAPLVTVALSPTVRGVGLNTETQQAVLVDPASNSITLFSVLDQSVSTFALETGAVAAAVNPLTNTGVVVNPTTGQASIINLRIPARLGLVNVGTAPSAVAIDAASNVALVVNKGSNNVTLIQLGAVRSLHVTEISPTTTFSSPSDLAFTVVGSGFLPGATVRFNETPIATSLISSRQLTATIPAALLSKPLRFVVDVQNPGSVVSNVSDFTVMQAISVGKSPSAVAIDPERNLAVVPNSGDNTVSLVDLDAGNTVATLTVGKNPQGAAVLSSAARAVVTNQDDGTATVLDLANKAVSTTVTVGTQPIGVAINPATGETVVANNNANTLSFFNATNPSTPTSLTVDQGPFAVAVDPTRDIAAVAQAAQNNVIIIDLANHQVRDRVPGFQLPTGAIYEPASDSFLVASSLSNNFVIINPDTLQTSAVRVGINPTSIDSNFNSGTVVTLNTSSQTMSVMDFLNQRVRAILPLSGAAHFSVAIHPRTNLAVVADGSNNRVLLVPLPR